MKSKLLILLSLFAFVGGVKAGQTTFYAKLTAEVTGNGKAYISSSNKNAGTEISQVLSNTVDDKYKSADVTFYAHATPTDGNHFVKWIYENEEYLENPQEIKINSSVTNKNSVSEKKIRAVFEPHTYDKGECTTCHYVHKESEHSYNPENSTCTVCGFVCTNHSWANGECSKCHYQHPADQHNYVNGTCSECKYQHPADQHTYDKGECTTCHYVHKESEHSYNPENSTCTVCGFVCTNHSWANGECSKCHYQHPADQHNYVSGTCSICKYKHPADQHNYDKGECTICHYVHKESEHIYNPENSTCTVCGFVCTSHSWTNGECTKCHYLHPADQHNYVNGTCSECKYQHPADQHSYDNGVCTICQLSHANHQYDADGLCTTCHIFQYSKSNENTLKAIAQIANPRFDNASSASWETSNEGGNVNFVSTNAVEFFDNEHFHIHQTLTGIPNGRYTVSVQGFYRGGVGGSTTWDNQDTHNAYLYAKGLTTETQDLANLVVAQQTRWRVGNTPNGYIEIHTSPSIINPNGTSHYVPDNTTAANAVFNNSEIGPKLIATVTVDVTDGTLTIGVKDNGSYIEKQWVYLDNFTLNCDVLSPFDYTFAPGQTELDLSTAGEILPTKFNKQNSPNALIFASNTTGIKNEEGNAMTKNVVVKGTDGSYTCNNLELEDDVKGAFSTSKSFTANTATYRRTAPSSEKYGTIYLPYKVKSTDAIHYYTLAEASKDNLTLDDVVNEELPAYTPAIYKVIGGGSTLEFSASNVEVPVSQESEGELVGVLQATAVCESDADVATANASCTPVVAENSYYIKGDKFWQINKHFNLMPFRSYLSFANALEVRAESLSIGLDDLETAIDAINAQDSELKIFDLSGRRLEKLQKGVNIVNGKKILVK